MSVPGPSAKSYLNIENIIQAAKDTDADAIHGNFDTSYITRFVPDEDENDDEEDDDDDDDDD